MSGITPTVHPAPPAGHIYTTGPVRLQRYAEGGSPDWMYRWFREGQSSPPANDPNHYIDSASLADAGQYRCKIQQGEIMSIMRIMSIPSSIVSLSVTGESEALPSDGLAWIKSCNFYNFYMELYN